MPEMIRCELIGIPEGFSLRGIGKECNGSMHFARFGIQTLADCIRGTRIKRGGTSQTKGYPCFVGKMTGRHASSLELVTDSTRSNAKRDRSRNSGINPDEVRRTERTSTGSNLSVSAFELAINALNTMSKQL